MSLPEAYFFLAALLCKVTYSLLAPTRGNIAFIRVYVSVCLRECVCPHDRTKTAETTITKLSTGIVHHESWLYPFNICRSKVMGHPQVTKHYYL